MGNRIMYAFDNNLNTPEETFIKITPDIIPGILPIYYISNLGNIYSEYKGGFLSPEYDKDGYKKVTLCMENDERKRMFVHRLLMLTFCPIPNADEMKVNHIDGVKDHSVLSNLEWVTPRENNLHAYRILQVNRHSVVSEESVRKACQLMQDTNYGNAEIARILINDDISEKVISDIRKGRTWNRISEQYDIREGNNRTMPSEFVHKICEYFQINPYNPLMMKKDYYKNALNYAGVIVFPETIDAARNIYSRRSYVNISCNYNF